MADGPVTYTDKGGGGELPPHGEDYFNRIVNVHWPKKRLVGGAFSFVGNVLLDVVTPGDVNGPGAVDTHASWLGGTSVDGEKWESAGPVDANLAFNCNVRGKVGERIVTVAAGLVVIGPFNFGEGYGTSDAAEPAAGISYDDGLTWSDAGIPLQQYVLRPPNPITGESGDVAQGSCNAVAYHPTSETFYVGGSVFFFVTGDMHWEDRMYSGTGGSFSQVYSNRRGISDPFEGYLWPPGGTEPGERLLVADRTATTPASDSTLFVVSFSPNQRAYYVTTNNEASYVAVNEDGTGVILGDRGGAPLTNISPPMARVNSVCGGKGHIVAVGWRDEDARFGPVTFVSDDDGQTWTEQLAALTATNPAPEDINGGSSAGSCSFS